MSATLIFAEAVSTRTQPFTPPTLVASLTRITKRYGNGVLALDDLSLTLRRGEIVALLGPNGAGKSTAVKLMMGLSSPSAGTVRIFGDNPRNTAARLRTGVMLQVGRAPEMLRVREHINIFRGYYPAPMNYADIIKAAALEGIEERFFGQLSSGQKQRVLFGIALAGDPDLIFLEEPTVSLDIECRRVMWQQIRSFAAHGKTVLLTTHYLEEADALCHRIIVINKGKVVCEGTPAEVKSMGFGHTTSQALKIIRCSTTLTAEHLQRISGVTTVETAGALTTITTTQHEATLREMLALDNDLHFIEVQSPLLEDAFRTLTSNS
jgi:ABC-2 type transport system ATP-binding protein